jgi:hypothetical protein
MRLVGHVASMREKRLWWESQKQRDCQEDIEVGERILLKWISK